MKNIIFFDVDGTIYDGGDGIHQAVIDAIHETQAKGNLCFICSGRPYGFIADNVRKIGFDGYVLANGASVLYNHQSLFVAYMDYARIRNFINYFDEEGFQYILATADHTYLKKEFTYLWDFYNTCNIDTNQFITDFDVDEVLYKTIKIEVYYRSPDNIPALNVMMYDFFFMDQGSSLVGEITRQDITKGTGIRKTLEQLGIDQAHSYCFGDGANDIEMFKAVGHPIAMENAIDEIKNLSESVCASVYNDGVAKKLKELF